MRSPLNVCQIVDEVITVNATWPAQRGRRGTTPANRSGIVVCSRSRDGTLRDTQKEGSGGSMEPCLPVELS